ncbi:FAD/NAD(P)-binding oxidoreductase, partial [Isoptericola sp. QY 916]|nr:FAD/NAD(P)-binding oxidoreductase [Isoptericola sp. QY 916]
RRAGLGPCQARICGRTGAELVGAAGPAAGEGTGAAPAVPDRRPLVVPVRLGDLATLPDDPT